MKSTAKLVAAFMKLFLANDFVLDEKSRSIETMCWSLAMSPNCIYFRFLVITSLKPTEHKMSSSPCEICTKLVV